MVVRVLDGDCRGLLVGLGSGSVHCVVTSPPYFGLRDYGTATWEGGDAACNHVVGEWRKGLGMAALGARYSGGGHKYSEPALILAKGSCPKCGAVRLDGQMGLEATPEEYVAKMVGVFREVRRVLRDDGTLWLNIGDSYASGGGTGAQGSRGQRFDRRHTQETFGDQRCWPEASIKPKDLIGIPWMLAFALRADGWYLRSEIIWAKPNPMPESITDRPTKAHEQVFLLTKRPRYFYDAEAIREPGVIPAGTKGAKGSAARFAEPGVNSRPPKYKVYNGTRNVRSVWTISTKPFAEAHFATFPTELAERCILAGTSARGCCPRCGAGWVRQIEKVDTGRRQKMADGWEVDPGGHVTVHRKGRTKGETGIPVTENVTTGWAPSCACPAAEPIPATVLDPFGGAGTVGLVADRLQRDAVMLELNPEYADMARRRIGRDAGFLTPLAAE